MTIEQLLEAFDNTVGAETVKNDGFCDDCEDGMIEVLDEGLGEWVYDFCGCVLGEQRRADWEDAQVVE